MHRRLHCGNSSLKRLRSSPPMLPAVFDTLYLRRAHHARKRIQRACRTPVTSTRPRIQEG
eukprot:5080444-Pleurochrysis_carterae.AAC.1